MFTCNWHKKPETTVSTVNDMNIEYVILLILYMFPYDMYMWEKGEGEAVREREQCGDMGMK